MLIGFLGTDGITSNRVGATIILSRYAVRNITI